MAEAGKSKKGFIFVNRDQLIKAPWNYKKDNKKKARALKNNIKQNGQVENIIVRELKDKKYEIVNGNHRYDTFKDLDFKQVFVFNMGKVPLLAAKRLAIETNETKFEADEENLAQTINELIAEFSLDNLELTMPFTDSEFANFSTKLLGKSSDTAPLIDRGGDLRAKWKTKLGQLWQLGEHKIICGDSTDETIIKKVLAGDKIRLVWTDPPYGVNFQNRVTNLSKTRANKRLKSYIANDDIETKKLKIIITTALRLALNNSLLGCAVYIACPSGRNSRLFQDAFDDSGFTWKHTLTWVKNSLVLGRADYHYRHEDILYGWNENGSHYWGGGRNKDSVFEINRPMKSLEHPTIKPVELIEPMISNSSKIGEIVYEPFAGSGSTLIACENLKRKCRAIEMSPEYMAVCIQRWVDITGEKPKVL